MPALHRTESGSNCDHAFKASQKFFKSTNLLLSLIGESKLCQKQYTKHYNGIQSTGYACFSIEYRSHPISAHIQ